MKAYEAGCGKMNKQPCRFIGKGKYDRKFHLLQDDGGLIRRICVWKTVYGVIIKGEKITCENCQVRQNDDVWQ